MLADRTSGRCIATSAWQTREAMLASEPQLRPLRDHAAEILGARPQVDQWEIAVCTAITPRVRRVVRVTWVRMEPERADRVVDVYGMALLPVMQDYDGFCSASLLTDRASGLAVSSVTYDSLEAMSAARKGRRLAREGATETGVGIIEVCESELALHTCGFPKWSRTGIAAEVEVMTCCGIAD